MKYAIILSLIAGSAFADSSSLSLALPTPNLNTQSDRIRSGSIECSNSISGSTLLEYGLTGLLSGLNTDARGKDIGVYARIVIPLNAPKKRIECQKLFEVELLQRKMEIRMLQEELNAMKNLQSTNMEFEN